MIWTRKIFSTLKTWVFKKKLLKFSTRFRREPMACFYCPEMCRFSCGVAETLRTNAITPRGKMSLLHWQERGASAESLTGGKAELLWTLEQCTGCGRCTEYCLHEIDVASELRLARKALHAQDQVEKKRVSFQTPQLKGSVLLCAPGRAQWWTDRPLFRQELDEELDLASSAGVVELSSDFMLRVQEWMSGKLEDKELHRIRDWLAGAEKLWIESPDAGWFIAKGIKEESDGLKAQVRLVWQKFFPRFSELQFDPETAVHESFYLSRLFPRAGYSIPVFERGNMPFHHGWNVWDCGGEGFYRHHHPHEAAEMAERFLHDVSKDGRKLRKIICQSPSCVEHLKNLTDVRVSYWLDEIGEQAL